MDGFRLLNVRRSRALSWNAESLLAWVASHVAWDILVLVVTLVYKRLKDDPISTLQIILGVVISGIAATLAAIFAVKSSTDTSIWWVLVYIPCVVTVVLFGVGFLLLELESAASRLKRVPVSFGKLHLPVVMGAVIAAAVFMSLYVVYLFRGAVVFLLGLL